jgi:hypothetical protein
VKNSPGRREADPTRFDDFRTLTQHHSGDVVFLDREAFCQDLVDCFASRLGEVSTHCDLS